VLEQISSVPGWWPSFLGQQLTAPFTALPVLMILSIVGERVGFELPRGAFGLEIVLVPMALSFVMGWIAQRRWPWLFRAGRFVWILPVSMFIYGFLLSVYREPVVMVISEYFLPSAGDEGVIKLFETMPTASSCGYVLGLIVAHRYKHFRKESGTVSISALPRL